MNSQPVTLHERATHPLLPALEMLTLGAVVTLYLLGREDSCSLDLDNLILSYIIIKGVFITLKILFYVLAIRLGSYGRNASLAWTMFWVIAISLYYAVAIYEFFRDSNDCKEFAHKKWIAHLIIVVEGLITLAFVVVLILAIVLSLCKRA